MTVAVSRAYQRCARTIMETNAPGLASDERLVRYNPLILSHHVIREGGGALMATTDYPEGPREQGHEFTAKKCGTVVEEQRPLVSLPPVHRTAHPNAHASMRRLCGSTARVGGALRKARIVR